MGVDIVPAGSAEQALTLLENDAIDLVVADLGLPGANGIELTRELRARDAEMPIILVTGSESIAHVVEALKAGANDYLQKPVHPDRLTLLIRELLRERGAKENDRVDARPIGPVFEGMVGISPAMREVFARIARIAPTSAPVLIVGESGTGKELVAKALHGRSRCKAGPFVAMHTGAIPKELVASELFGHEKGSFTGAMNSADGKFAAAEKGTLFLDEVGTMDIPTQISLLRVLETYRYSRVGASRERAADVRIVAATNSDLLRDVQDGRFREDLFYRLNVLTIMLPPLRERREDIVPLAERFLTAACKRFEVSPKKLSSEAMGALSAHPWPGNVRELRNAMDQVAVFARGDVVQAFELELLPARLRSPRLRDEREMASPEVEATCEPEDASPAVAEPTEDLAEDLQDDQSAVSLIESPPHGADDDHRMVVRVPIGTPLAEVEKMLVLRTLEAEGGNKQRAARILGISRRGLYVKLVSYGEHVAIPEVETTQPQA
jgi:DNA-binding NtrC family response regulator